MPSALPQPAPIPPAPGQTALPFAESGSKVRVCEEFSREPIFPFRPTDRPVVFHGADEMGAYELELGAIDKFSPKDRGPKRCPSLCIDHAILLLAHFERYRIRPLGSEFSSPSFNKLWGAFSGSKHPPSKNQRAAFKALMHDLDFCRMRQLRPGAAPVVYNLLESEVEHVRRPGASGLMGSRYANFRFHPVFLRTILYAPITRDVNLADLRAMTSRYARTAYLWLPSRAARSPAGRPFIISSAKLWEQMGLRGTILKQRADVLNKTPMLRELDAVRLLDGRRMRIIAVRGADDIFLHVWSEDDGAQNPALRFNLSGPLATAFQKSGRNQAEYIHCLRTRTPLDDYEMDLLVHGGIENIEGSVAFFEISREALGPAVFRQVLAEAKGFKIEGGEASESFGARLRAALLNRIALPVQKKAE